MVNLPRSVLAQIMISYIQSTVTKSLDDANDPIIFYIKLSTLKKQTLKEIVCAQ